MLHGPAGTALELAAPKADPQPDQFFRQGRTACLDVC
jgi:hypothetical protein